MDTFWSATGHSNTFDPRVLYDTGSGRWIASAAAANADNTNSVVLIGASAGSDPTGAWKVCAVQFDLGNTTWADFPMLGYDGTRVVVTVNVFNLAGTQSIGSTVFIWTKTDVINMALSCAGTTARVRNASGAAAAMSPATSFDSGSTTMYLVEDWDGNPGGGAPGQVRLSSITGALGSEALNEGFGFVSANTGNTWTYAGDPLSFSDFAPQKGSSAKIDTGDSRMSLCVLRFGSLWCAHTAFVPAGANPTHSVVQWWQINPRLSPISSSDVLKILLR